MNASNCLPPTAAEGGSVSRRLSNHIMHSIVVDFTHWEGRISRQFRTHTSRIHIPATVGKEGIVSRQNSTYNPLRYGRLHLLAAAVKESRVSRQSRAHTGRIHIHTTAGKRSIVSRQLSSHAVHSIADRFTYVLHQRQRSLLAGDSAQMQSTVSAPSQSDSLTGCSSEGELG